ncbi:fluoride efflux transporter CrcB [Ectobacillus funiculus]
MVVSLGQYPVLALAIGLKQDILHLFPIGTLLINLLGSFFYWDILSEKESIKAGSFYLVQVSWGAFTTFSTFKLESIQLHANKKWKVLALYLGISYTFGILLAF